MQEYTIESETCDARKWNEIKVMKMLSDQTKQRQIMKLERGRHMLIDYSHGCSVPLEEITNDVSN